MSAFIWYVDNFPGAMLTEMHIMIPKKIIKFPYKDDRKLATLVLQKNIQWIK